jgi:hypothetical protein
MSYFISLWFSSSCIIVRSVAKLWNTSTISTFLCNIVFYPQHVLQYNYSVHVVYTLVILSTFKISAWQYLLCVYSVEILLMMNSGPVRNMWSTLSNKFEKLCTSLSFIIRRTQHTLRYWLPCEHVTATAHRTADNITCCIVNSDSPTV